MSMYVRKTLDDGAVLVGDGDDPNYEAVLKPGQFKNDMSRADVDAAVQKNATNTQRSQNDEQARETAENAQTGEAHQQ